MDLLPDEEQQQIIDTAAQFFSSEHTLEKLLQNSSGVLREPALWQQMAGLGFLGISQPEEAGGSGLTAVEDMLLLVEAGRQLVSPSLLASMVAATLASQTGRQDLAAEIIAGQAMVALAAPIAGTALVLDDKAQTANGQCRALELPGADYLLICQQEAAALVKSQDINVQGQLECIDEKISLHTIGLDNAAAQCLDNKTQDGVLSYATLMRTAYLLGLVEHITELTLDYAKQREQFEKPIGSFQAIKHKFAEMALRNEAARATTLQACLQFAGQTQEAPLDCATAAVLTSEAAIHNAADCIQIHGGMGFTTEMPVHLFYKRAQLLSQLFASEHGLLHDVVDYPASA